MNVVEMTNKASNALAQKNDTLKENEGLWKYIKNLEQSLVEANKQIEGLKNTIKVMRESILNGKELDKLEKELLQTKGP